MYSTNSRGRSFGSYRFTRSTTWFDTSAGNQRTWSRAWPRSSVTYAGAAAITVTYAPGQAQRLRPVGGDPDGEFSLPLGPLELGLRALVVHLSAGGEVPDQTAGLLQPLQRHRTLPDHTPRAIPPADAALHPPTGDLVEGGQRARGHGQVARRRVGDARPQPDLRRVCGLQCEDRIDLLPQHVGIPDPRVVEAVVLGELRHADDA